MTLTLEPEDGVELVNGVWSARSSRVWLRVAPAEELTSRRWIRIRYSSSYYDDPVRPLIRFTTVNKREFVFLMNGPVLGRSEWIGRVPPNSLSVSVSPQGTLGAFDFQVESVQRIRRPNLMLRGIQFDPYSLFQSIGAKIINAPEERWGTLQFAATATPFESYAEWHRRLYRAIDVDGIDRARSDWNSTPTIRLLMSLGAGGTKGLIATVSSLQDQVYGRWSLHGLRSVDTPSDVLSVFRELMRTDPRLQEADDDTKFSALATDVDPDDYVGLIDFGDMLPEYALAVIAERVIRASYPRIVYGDEDAIGADGKLHSPMLKPNLNSIIFEASHYFGRLTCLRYAEIRQLGLHAVSGLVRNEAAVLKRVTILDSGAGIEHIRRILYRRWSEKLAARPESINTLHSQTQAPVTEELPEVTVVIPTRDRADLLTRCTNGLRQSTNYPRLQVVLVDNGTMELAARARLESLRRLPNFHILERPGKFNFSSLCNDGAQVTNSPILVFLNNDVAISDPAWLRALVRWAVQPRVGAVGAKLLFPDNSIEHAGVVLGHGGMAGHIYHKSPASEQGYLGQLVLPREVAAVTAACVAIPREKFDAVGGFDAKNLPVDLNDIDICLRLSERGWKIVWTPEAVLYHQQSASRGFPLKPFTVYSKERHYFLQKWMDEIRDDPYFHPALSLFSHMPALG